VRKYELNPVAPEGTELLARKKPGEAKDRHIKKQLFVLRVN